jgi:hypothetical protein
METCGKEEKNMIPNHRLVHTIVALVASCLFGEPGVAVAAQKAKKPEEGFVGLFDGKTLKGWHIVHDAKFVAEDGVIKLNGGLGWLRSEKEYSDLILRLEFRFMKPKQDGGVFLRSNTEGKPWPGRKYEVQIENTDRMAKIFGAEHKLDVELTKRVLKPDGQWNEYEIKLVGSTLEVRLNGKLVSKSERTGGLKRGYLGLQAEHGFHEYRNFRIKDLSK